MHFNCGEFEMRSENDFKNMFRKKTRFHSNVLLTERHLIKIILF